MTSDAPVLLSIGSDPDVQVTIYDATGRRRLTGLGRVSGEMPRGLYRVQLDRCDFVSEHVIHHDSPHERFLAGPLVDSPAPLEISRDAREDGLAAQQLSAMRDESVPGLGKGEPDARLLVFVRRMSRAASTTSTASEPIPIGGVPSEPITIHDLAGRFLERMQRGDSHAAAVFRVPHGTYRLRVGQTRRDLAVTIPAHRAAHVFLADHGEVSLRTARVYLPRDDDPFDPALDIARAMESVLWALGQPRGELPAMARELLFASKAGREPAAARDPSFGLACAHLLWRQAGRSRAALAELLHRPDRVEQAPGENGDPTVARVVALELGGERDVEDPAVVDELRRNLEREEAAFDGVLRALSEHAAELPDVVILRRLRDEPAHAGSPPSGAIAAGAGAETPPLFRASLVLAVAEQHPVGLHSALAQAAIAGHDDSVWCTWSPRWWDERWVEPTVAKLRRHPDEPRSVEDVAREMLLPAPVVEQALARLDGGAPSDEQHSLFDRLATLGGPIPLGEACDLVLRALEALRDRGVVHGQIHPGNLMVRNDGGDVLRSPGASPGAAVGAAGDAVERDRDEAHFMAPEAVLDPGATTQASDVWSMAATLYFALTLELPRERFTGQSEHDAARDNKVVSITDRRTELPELLPACIAGALERNPAARPGRERFHGELRSAVLPDLLGFRASELLRRQQPAVANTIRNVFLRMTLVGRDVVRPRVFGDELSYKDPEDNRRVEQVLRQLLDLELITVRHRHPEVLRDSECFDPVPELVSGWPQLQAWRDELDAIPGARGLLIELRDEARAWHANHPDPSLWGRERILLAERVRRDGRVTYSALEDEFLRRSRRRLAWRDAVASVGAVALAFLFLVLAWRGKTAVEDTAVASTDRDRAVSEAQSAQALVKVLAPSLQEIGRQRLLDGRPFQALPYFVEAGRAGDIPPSLRMLFGAASRNLSLDHRDTVVRAAFDRTGSRVVTASRDGTARIWNALTGERIALLRHEAAVTSAVFSPDGTRIVTASEDRTAQIWDANGHRVCPPLQHGHFVLSAAFSPDGKHVVTASLDHSARIWDAATGAREHELGHDDAVWTASFSPDGKHVVTASWDHTARIWDAATGAAAGPALAHHDLVWSAAFSPDGTRVVTASQDKTAQLWDAATGKPVGPVLQHDDGVTSATFDAKGRYVVTTSWDDRARVWDAGSGAPVSPPLVHRGAVVSAAFSPDGARVITASSDGAARIWDTVTGQLVHAPLDHAGPVTGAAFSADGTRAITASADRTVRVWDAISDRPPVALDVSGEVRSAAFSPDGGRMVAVTGDNLARIFDTATGKLVGSPLVHQAAVRTAVFSPDGRSIATASDRVVQIWDAVTARMLTAPLEHPGRVTSVTFSPDGAQVITTSGDVATRRDDTLRIWNARTGVRTAVSLAYPDRFVSARMSSDGTRLVTLNQEQTARIWDATTGAAITPPLDQRDVTSVAFSPDGGRVVTASEDPDDHTARVWDAASGKLLVPPLEHHDRVESASFSPEGARIITVSHDRTVRVWDATTGNPLTLPLHQGAPIVAAAFSVDRSDANRSRIVSVDGHALRTWDVSLDPRSLGDWSNLVDRGPYVLQDGVLMLRSLAVNTQLVHRSRSRKPSS